MDTFCAYYNNSRCRSCDWLGLDYATQLARKQARLEAALDGARLLPPVGSHPQGFRNRAKMAVTGTVAEPIIGLTGPECELDRGQELMSCPIHHPRLGELMRALPAWITRFGVEPYRIQARTGELKGVIAFYSPASREMYVRFVLRSRDALARLRELLPVLQGDFADAVCVTANLQPVPHAILEGPEEIFLTERRWIEHDLGAVRLRLAPRAFVQTNQEIASRLYAQAAEWIAEAGPARMMELYCGQGAFSFFAARTPGIRILGIEINEEAVRTANETARALGLDHVGFRALDATRVGTEIAAFAPDLVLANPPRRGLTSAGVALLLEHSPAHLIYSSCSIDSLERDVQALSVRYRVRQARVFDLFPHTEHFETLAWLERR